jgi:hypothetical protein
VGATRFGTVSITNTGSRDASLDALAIIDEQPPGQCVLPEHFQRLLVPGQQTSVSVIYTPTTRGPAHAGLAVDMRSATDQPSVTYRRRYVVPLSASGRMPVLFLARGPRRGPVPLPSVPELQGPVLAGPLAPDATSSTTRTSEPELTLLDFGLAPVGDSVLRSFWIRNVGDDVLTVGVPQPLEVSRLTVANLANFPSTLAPGGELEVPLWYSSGYVPGLRSESELRISSDDPLRPEIMLRVVIRAAGPHFVEPPEVIDLGVVSSGTGTIVAFASDGSQPVSVSEVRLVDGRDFTLSGVPPLPIQVAPGSALTLATGLIATAPGPYQDQLIVHHDGNRSRESSILLRATIA